MRYKLFILIFNFFSIAIMQGQPLKTIPYTANLDKAEEYAASNHYASELTQLEDAYKKKRDRSLLPRMADLAYKIRDNIKAENYFKRVVDMDKNGVNNEARFYYANTLKMNGKYDLAREHFNSILTTNEQPWSDYAKIEIDGLDFAMNADSIPDFFISNAGTSVNSRSGDFSPFMHDGILYYTQANPEVKSDPDGKYKVYFTKSVKNEQGKWGKAEMVSNEITSSSEIIGNVYMDPNENILYLTKAKVSGEEVVYSQIYYSVQDGSSWSDPVKVEGLFDSAIVTNPMTGDLFGKKVLFFSSNAPGGLGGYDIYYANRNSDGSFDSPVNLGPQINTTANEGTPFYREGKLVFSSDGMVGFGGFDLFQSTWTGSGWTKVTNMGWGYNSTADDRFFYLDPEGYQGFLTSNRLGTVSVESKTCCDDLFYFTIRKPVVDVNVMVMDNKKGLKGATISIMERGLPETNLSETDEEEYEYAYDLGFNKQYKIKVEKIGYFPDSVFISSYGIKHDSTFNVVIDLKPKPEIELVSINQPIRMNNIYYDYNSAKILPASEPDLTFLYDLMIQYPTMVIELSSHTDSRGSDSYNLKLSQQRAESAAAYLVAKGIDTARIVPKGYGETVILNECANGVKCTEDKHRFNRRTEFKIIAGPTTIEIKKRVTKERGKVIKTENIEPGK